MSSEPTADTLREVARQARLTSDQLLAMRRDLDRMTGRDMSGLRRIVTAQPSTTRDGIAGIFNQLRTDIARQAILEVNGL